LTETGHSVRIRNPFSGMGFHSVLDREFQSVLIGFNIACIFWLHHCCFRGKLLHFDEWLWKRL